MVLIRYVTLGALSCVGSTPIILLPESTYLPFQYTMATFLVMLFFHHILLRIFNYILAPPTMRKKSKLLSKVGAKIVENQLKKY